MEQDVTRNIEEQLSAFLDGELPDDELQLLVRRLERDDEHRATLARYAAIGSMLRAEPAQLTGNTLRQRVVAALNAEDDNVAPPQTAVEPEAKAVSYSYARNALIAASVAVLAIVGVYTLGTDTPTPAEASANQGQQFAARSTPQLEAGVATGTAAEVSTRTRADRSGGSARKAAITPERMTSYLVSHGEYSRSFQGAMVDSRIFVQQASFER